MKKLLFVLLGTVSAHALFGFGDKKSEDKENSVVVDTIKGEDQDIDVVTPKKNFDPSQGFADVVEGALPAVVNIATTQIIEGRSERPELPDLGGNGSPFEDLFKKFFEQQDRPKRVQSLGSGFIIKVDSEKAYVVTNHHVVSDANKISLFMNDKTEVSAQVHGTDERTDIAVISFNLKDLPEKKRKIHALQWERQGHNRVGDWVIAIGNPFGLGSSVTVGVVSSKGRDLIARGTGRLSDYVDDYIQHSAQINFGNSGGCLLNTRGRVLGINTAIFSNSGGNVGIGFAIPYGVAKATVDQLIEFGRTKRGWLGVKIQNLTPEMAESLGLKGGGAIVSSITKDGPASKAGLKPHDIIIEYNGIALDESSRLSRLVGETKVGSEVKIKALRKGKKVNLTITIGEYESIDKAIFDEKTDKTKKDDPKATDVEGITLTPMTKQMRERLGENMQTVDGLVVLKVNPASAASEIGLVRGDVIRDANQKELSTPDDFKKIIETARSDNKSSILLLVFRDGEPRYVLLRLDEEIQDKNKKAAVKKSKQQVDHAANNKKARM